MGGVLPLLQRNVRIAAQMLVLAVTRKKENEHYPPRANLENFSNFQPSLPQSAGGKSMARLMVLPGDRDHALQLLEELQRRAGEDDSAEDVE